MATNHSTPESPVAPAVVGPVAGTMRGIVDVWHARIGLGYVVPDSNSEDSFRMFKPEVEEAGLIDILKKGTVLDFNVVDTENGPIAGNLRLVTT